MSVKDGMPSGYQTTKRGEVVHAREFTLDGKVMTHPTKICSEIGMRFEINITFLREITLSRTTIQVPLHGACILHQPWQFLSQYVPISSFQNSQWPLATPNPYLSSI